MTLDAQTLQAFLDACIPIAYEAGAAILQVAAEGTDVQVKQDGSPLTRADMASDAIIAAGLAPLEPKLPILSEEGDVEDSSIGTWRTFWCVDPLDGTKEFVKGLSEYTVNIAIVEDAQPVLGVVYVPVQDVMYYGAKSLGAWKVSSAGQPVRIASSAAKRPAKAVVSRSHLSDETKEFLVRLGVTDMVAHGSSLKICAVAEGAADIYPRHGPTCLWDTAAGAAIAIEAGCNVVDLAGAPLSYDPSVGIKRAGFIVLPAQFANCVP